MTAEISEFDYTELIEGASDLVQANSRFDILASYK